VQKCQDLPGQQLFEYENRAGEVATIASEDVNDYLQRISGQPFTAKDFRPWAGTVLAAIALGKMEEVDSQTLAKRNIVTAIEAVARLLGNTVAICRRCLYPSRNSYQLSRWDVSSDVACESRLANRPALARVEAGGGCRHDVASAGPRGTIAERRHQAQAMRGAPFRV
jgi:hypothetical protein